MEKEISKSETGKVALSPQEKRKRTMNRKYGPLVDYAFEIPQMDDFDFIYNKSLKKIPELHEIYDYFTSYIRKLQSDIIAENDGWELVDKRRKNKIEILKEENALIIAENSKLIEDLKELVKNNAFLEMKISNLTQIDAIPNKQMTNNNSIKSKVLNIFNLRKDNPIEKVA